MIYIIFTLSESFEKCPRSANIASAPEILAASEMPKYNYKLQLIKKVLSDAELDRRCKPVMHRTIPPSELQPSWPAFLKKLYMQYGDRARMTLGFHLKILYMPIPPMQPSQASKIGANRNPTRCVPQCCSAKRPIKTKQAKSTV